MSLAPIQSTANSIQRLTNSIMNSVDVNGDGQLSLDEFGRFLANFMQSVVGRTTTASGATGSITTTPLLGRGTALATESRANQPLPPVLPGWKQEKWVNSAHTTIKYVAGRVMARYEPSEWVNPSTREQILADFRAAGLNPTASGKDTVDFNDGAGPIDIVQGASVGGKAWQWLPSGS